MAQASQYKTGIVVGAVLAIVGLVLWTTLPQPMDIAGATLIGFGLSFALIIAVVAIATHQKQASGPLVFRRAVRQR